MQLVDGVDIHADFSACQMGQAAAKGKDRQAFVGHASISGCKDIIVYAADENCRLYGDIHG